MNSKINRIFKKSLAFVILIIFFAIAVSLSIYLSLSNKAFNDHIKSIEKQKNYNTVTSLNLTFKQITTAAHYFGTVNMRILYDVNSKNDFMERSNLINQIDSTLTLLDSVEALTVERGSVRIGSKMSVSPDESIYDPEVINKKFYGYFQNVGIYDVSDYGYQYDLYMKLSQKSQSSIYNNVYIGVDSMKFAESVFKNSGNNRQELLIDDTGRIIVSTIGSNINKTLGEIYDFNIDLSEEKTSQIVKLNGKKSIVTIDGIENLKLYVVNIVDINEYSDYISKNTAHQVVFAVVLFVSISAIAFFVFKFTYRPIRQIADNISSYPMFVPESGLTDVEYINSKFNTLVTENKRLTDTVNKKMGELRFQQVLTLQTQICPHFMYNTLETLNWIAYRELDKYDNPISYSLNNIAELLELSMDLLTVFRTIRDEIYTTNKYINILNVRYGNQFAFKWSVDEELLDCKILKMCIQPLIENTVIHAFENCDKSPEIEISINSFEGNIKISVSDNGNGIEQGKLAELQAGINDFSSVSKRHIGIKNINHRIKLLYGESYGICIESTQGVGTVCSFTIPDDR